MAIPSARGGRRDSFAPGMQARPSPVPDSDTDTDTDSDTDTDTDSDTDSDTDTDTDSDSDSDPATAHFKRVFPVRSARHARSTTRRIVSIPPLILSSLAA